jgi:DUF4097 and DUF4098 domain-containing protein YvlB
MKKCPTSTQSIQHRGLPYCLLIALFIMTSCGRSTRLEEHNTQSIVVPANSTVVIENFQGLIDVSTYDQDTITVDVTKVATDETRAKALEALKDIEVSISQEDNTISVIAHRKKGASEGACEAQLTVRVPSGSWVNVLSGMGDVSFHGELPNGDNSFHSGNGNINIALPATTSFSINALTGNGKIYSDIPIERSGEEAEEILVGTSGENPLVSITTTTSNGDITISREK